MGEPHAHVVEDVEDRVPAVGEVLVAGVDHRPGDAGGNIATYFQIDDPVKPTTASTPSLRAARAVIFISSAARCRTPSGSPSPQIRSGRMPRCRSSIGSSQTAWPLRWLEMAQTFRPYFSSISSLRRDVGVVLDRRPRVEVVAPAGDLEAVVAPARGEPAHLLERQVGPLAGEQGDRSGHGQFLSRSWRSCGDRPARSRCVGAASRPREHRWTCEPVGERRAAAGRPRRSP